MYIVVLRVPQKVLQEIIDNLEGYIKSIETSSDPITGIIESYTVELTFFMGLRDIMNLLKRYGLVEYIVGVRKIW